MIAALTTILLCQLAGEVLARGVGLPIPGPVLGLVLMLLVLGLRDRFRARLPDMLTGPQLETTGKTILAHLSLLFVPAGVGVVQRLDVFGAYATALAITLVVSTVAALIATLLTFKLVLRLTGDREVSQ
ncbi:CidA/LrgA family protein [Ferrovibrio terrae]|uniref:CidA/LrgA family protein n=1 Tax=Ferrovibrio terrae TaxID=2594003 RepID=UPI0031380A26